MINRNWNWKSEFISVLEQPHQIGKKDPLGIGGRWKSQAIPVALFTNPSVFRPPESPPSGLKLIP